MGIMIIPSDPPVRAPAAARRQLDHPARWHRRRAGSRGRSIDRARTASIRFLPVRLASVAPAVWTTGSRSVAVNRTMRPSNAWTVVHISALTCRNEGATSCGGRLIGAAGRARPRAGGCAVVPAGDRGVRVAPAGPRCCRPDARRRPAGHTRSVLAPRGGAVIGARQLVARPPVAGARDGGGERRSRTATSGTATSSCCPIGGAAAPTRRGRRTCARRSRPGRLRTMDGAARRRRSSHGCWVSRWSLWCPWRPWSSITVARGRRGRGRALRRRGRVAVRDRAAGDASSRSCACGGAGPPSPPSARRATMGRADLGLSLACAAAACCRRAGELRSSRGAAALAIAMLVVAARRRRGRRGRRGGCDRADRGARAGSGRGLRASARCRDRRWRWPGCWPSDERHRRGPPVGARGSRPCGRRAERGAAGCSPGLGGVAALAAGVLSVSTSRLGHRARRAPRRDVARAVAARVAGIPRRHALARRG